MKAKGILSLFTVVSIVFSSFGQKKDWNPEERTKAKIERFTSTTELPENVKKQLIDVLVSHQKEMKYLRQKEEKNKEDWKALREKKNTAIQQTLKSDELFAKWQEFEKEERVNRKSNHKRSHKEGSKKKCEVKKTNQLESK